MSVSTLFPVIGTIISDVRPLIFCQSNTSGSLSRAGHQQHCRDNVTMFSGQNLVDFYYLKSKFVVATPVRHQALQFFYCNVPLSHCRCRETKNCRVPSSAFDTLYDSKELTYTHISEIVFHVSKFSHYLP